jgi:peptidoglycan hydrolase CwlO-like protein
MSQSSQQKLLALATVAIIALLGLSAFLIYTKVNQDKLIKKQSAELIEETRVKAELEKEYYQALSDLEEMRGNNSELNAMIETQKAELKKQKDRIDGLIKTSKELEKARDEIAKLRSYVTEVEELRKQNASLQENNMQLSSQRDELVIAVQQEKITNEELTMAKNTLSSERDQLSQEKEALAKKVDIASSIKVSDISAIGYKVRSSGKETDSKKAKAIDGIKVCFKTTSNVIVSSGKEKFYLRLINPLGEVMAIQDLGSGNMKLGNTSESVQYTQSVELDYQSDPIEGCINWQPGITFETGTYGVELYNKGFLAGKGSFVLK